MRSVPTTSLDLADPAFLADPYPFLARERASHEVAWHEPSQSFLTFSHATVGAVQRDLEQIGLVARAEAERNVRMIRQLEVMQEQVAALRLANGRIVEGAEAILAASQEIGRGTQQIAAVARVNAGHHFDQRAFSGAVFAHQGMNFTGPGVEIDAVERDDAGKDLG